MFSPEHVYDHPGHAEKVPLVLAKAMQKRNFQALRQLQALKESSIPETRKHQLNRLIDNTQTYLMFLEDLMGQQKSSCINEVEAMLNTIDQHCHFISRACADLNISAPSGNQDSKGSLDSGATTSDPS